MKLTKITILLLTAAAFSNCKKTEAPTNVVLKNNSSLNAGNPVYDLLGYGYDVTGKFADSQSSRLSVIDVTKFVASEPASLPNDNDVSTNFEYHFGDNATSFSRDLSQKYSATAGLAIFKGEVNAAFHETSEMSSKYVLATSSMLIKQKRWKLYSTTENLRSNYLSPNFLADVASLSPASLIQRYGTHVLTDITLGAKFNVSYQAETGNTNRTTSAKIGLKVNALFKVFGVTADYDATNTDTRANFNQTLYYNTSGGDGTKGLIGDLKLDNSPVTLTIGSWQSSCTAANAVLIKIGDDGLTPLEELIGDPVKSAAVKAYIAQYLADNAVTVIDDPSTGSQPIYQFFKQGTPGNYIPGHYLGYSPTENGWVGQGIVFRAFTSWQPGTQPVYEFWGWKSNRITYFYQFGTNQTGFWHLTGIKFYAYPAPVPGTVQVFGYVNKWGEDHLFTPEYLSDANYWQPRWQAFYTFIKP